MMGRRVAVAMVICTGAMGVAEGAMANPGDLDTTFSSDGKLVQDVENGRANGVAVDSKGRVVLAGNFDPAGSDLGDIEVIRYLSDGSPDPSFSGDGIATFDVSGAGLFDEASAVQIDSKGRIPVGGHTSDFNDPRVMVLRLTDAGVPDPSYGGGDGLFVQDLNGADLDEIEDIAVDPSGALVAAGIIGTFGDPNALVLRVTAAGTLDTSFNSPAGFDSFAFNNAGGSDDRGWGVALDSQGRTGVARGTVLAPGDNNFGVARVTAQGELDTTFSNDIPTPGRAIVLMSEETGSSMQDLAFDVEIASGDRPRVAGFAEFVASGDDFAVLGLDASGQPDASFSGDGKAYVDLGGEDDANRLAIDRNGALVLGGVAGAISQAQVGVARLTSAGLPDTAFSGDGKTLTDLGPGDDVAQDVKLDPTTGRIAIGGYEGPFITADYAAARYEAV